MEIVMEDEKIIRLIISRDEKGLELLLEKYQSFILYLLHGMLASYPQDLEECFNDIRLKLWNNIESFDATRSSLKTYITHIVRNAAIDKIRKIKREQRYIDKTINFDEGYLGTVANEQSAEEIVFNEENKKMFLSAIKKLKKKDQELFFRKYYYLQPNAQIAEELGRSEKTIEGRITKIRKKIKQYVKEV
jgi:RNA polymerase sigma-70 factor (ECF subfamily)